MYPISDFAAIHITKSRQKELMQEAEKQRQANQAIESNRQNRRTDKTRNREIR